MYPTPAATRFALALTAALISTHSAIASGQHAGGHSGASAIGEPGKAAQATRTVAIDMGDTLRFTPSAIAARQGETIRFVVRNSGQLKHELVLGTEKELREHAELMKKFPGMEHADPNMVSVAPGEAGEVIWKFSKAGRVEFACLQPGHYDAGMKGAVQVGAGPRKGAEVAVGIHRVQATTGAEMTEGEVRKIDIEAGKITLKHGEIRNLDMPGMTMVFTVKDKALLDKLKAGDKIRFKAINDAGRMTVIQIEPAR